jgi:hypothetical protein
VLGKPTLSEDPFFSLTSNPLHDSTHVDPDINPNLLESDLTPISGQDINHGPMFPDLPADDASKVPSNTASSNQSPR